MTLDALIDKSAQSLAELWLTHEAATMRHLSNDGATDDELDAALKQSRETLREELRKATHRIVAIWFTGEAGIH